MSWANRLVGIAVASVRGIEIAELSDNLTQILETEAMTSRMISWRRRKSMASTCRICSFQGLGVNPPLRVAGLLDVEI